MQITGDAEFNEVFFTDTRIPDSDRVGPVGEGWAVALTTLMNERIALSGAGSIGGDVSGGGAIGHLIARHAPVADPLMRQRLARSYISNQIIAWNNQRAAARRRSGGEAGPEGSITKLQQALHNQELQKLAVDLEGTQGMAWEGPSLTSGRQRRPRRRDRHQRGRHRAWLPPLPGQHHRGWHVEHHAQHPR